MHPRSRPSRSLGCDQSCMTKSHNMQSSICVGKWHTTLWDFIADQNGFYKLARGIYSTSGLRHHFAAIPKVNALQY